MKHHRQQYICLFLQIIVFIANCLAENIIFNINLKKPIAVTSAAFLSFTLDPTTLLQNAVTKNNIERSTNMARGLSPAYVRLGGPQSNFYIFERAYSHDANTDSSTVFFETWTLINQWAENAGLNIIACIAPRYMENKSETYSMNPMNITELLSFSDRMGYNVNWQLGYECQMRCNLSGGDLGQYVADFRKILKTFPRYSNSLIIGPDIVTYKTIEQQKYIKDYLTSTNGALSAITWHPEFAGVSLNNVSVYYDNIIVEKEEMYKIVSRTVGKKSLWIAESKPEKYKDQYLGALIWTKRLGNAAKLGIQVVMRQSSDLYKATPDYWVSLLHKTLVGREVLELKFQSNNESHVHFYSQCTKPSMLYEKGDITIFGLNLTPRKVTANLKDLKIKTLHKYILLPDSETGNKMFSEKVLLNNKPLNLINNEKLPDIYPEIIIDPDSLELELSPSSIGFWVIPNVKVKACVYSDEGTIKNIIENKLLKRHVIQQSNQEEREDINRINLKNRKVYTKQNSTKQEKAENEKINDEQKIWNTKLFAKIKRFVEKRVQRKEKNNPLNLRRSLTIDFGEEQNSLSEEAEKQQNLDSRNSEEAEIKEKFRDIRDTLKKYKRTLMEKKAQAKVEQNFKLEMRDINNAIALISKIEDLFQFDEETDFSFHIKIDSNESNMNKIKDKIKNKKVLVIGASKKLEEYLNKLENSAETQTNLIQKIENYFNALYNLLEDNESTKNNGNNQILNIYDSLIKEKRFRRDLNKKSEDSSKIATVERSWRRNDLTDYMIKRKMKRRNDHRKKLIPSDKFDNFLKNINNNKGKLLFKRGFVKKSLENDALTAQNTDYQHSMQEHKEMKRNDVYRRHSKINDMENYQNSMQKPEKMKRDTGRKLVEIGLRKDNVLRKHSKMDDVKDHINERKTKRKEGLLIPFKQRTTESDEDNFYGFFRQDPIKGFPKGDVFVTTGDSSEQNNKDYDYVEDEDDDNTASKKKNTQYRPKSTLSHTEDDTWIEVEGDHCNYMPNEFFENVKLSNTRIKDSSKNYGDLWEAEFFPEENKKDETNNNNGTIFAKVPQQQSLEEKEKQANGKSVQKLVNYYGNSKEQEQNAQYKVEYSSKPLDQFSKTATYINYQSSNIEPEETKLKMEPKSESSISFYQPSQVSAIKYYDNCQTSDIRQDAAKLKEEKDFVNILNVRDNVNTKTTQFLRPIDIHMEYLSSIFHNKRTKRSNWEKLRKILAEEMIKEDEENARDCHCRVIRATDSPKKLCIKCDSQVFTTQLPNSSSEAKNINTDIAQSKRYIRNPMTKKEYEEIMTGEILPSIIEPDYNEYDATMEIVTAKSSTLTRDPNNATQTTDIASTLSIDNSGINNIFEQHHNTNHDVESTTKIFVNSVAEHSLSENNTIKYVTKETFFRTQPSDVQPENETTTCEPLQNVPKISSDDQEKLLVSIIKNADETTHEKAKDFISKKEKTEICSTVTAQTNEEWHKNNRRIDLNSTNSSKEITKRTIEEQITTETILSKRATDKTINDSNSDKSKTKSKLQRNAENNQNSESKTWTQFKKDINTRGSKIFQSLPRAPFRELARYEEYLAKRIEQVDKLKEKLHAKREKLLRQYRHELTNIADEQKRNLNRRETWDRFRESYDFRKLIDRGGFIGVLVNDNVTRYNNEKYVVPIELTPKQYNNIIDRIYSLARVKEIHYSEYNQYHQFLQYLKVIENDGESIEASRFLDCEQDYQDSLEAKKNEPIETTSRFFDRRIFAIDPSTYRGGKPILQLHKDYSKNEKFTNYNGKDNIIDIEATKETEEIMVTENINISKEEILNTENSKNIATSKYKIEHLNNKREDKINNRPTKEINKLYSPNNGTEDNLNVTKYNKTIENGEKVIDDNLKESELGKEEDILSRTRRNIEKQMDDKYLERLPYFLTSTRSNRDILSLDSKEDYSKEDSEEIFNEQLIPFFLLRKKDRIPSNTILFPKLKNYLASSRKDFEINQQNEKKYISSRYIIFMPTKVKGIYEMLEINDYDDPSIQPIEIPLKWRNQYLLKKLTDSGIEYSDDKSLEEFGYEDFSDLQSKNTENISDKEDYTLESEQDSINFKDNRNDCESRKKDEYRVKSEEINKYLKMKDQFNEHEIFLLLPLRNKEKRQRRQIESEINENKTQMKREVQSKSKKNIWAQNLEDKSTRYYFNKNNIDKKEKEEMIKKKDIKINYLQSQLDRKNHDKFLEDFIKVHKKNNNLYNNEIPFAKNEKKNKSLKTNILKDDKKLSTFVEKAKPNLENAIDSSERKNLTESMEQFIDYSERNNTLGPIDNTFHVAIINIKKFFSLISNFFT